MGGALRPPTGRRSLMRGDRLGIGAAYALRVVIESTSQDVAHAAPPMSDDGCGGCAVRGVQETNGGAQGCRPCQPLCDYTRSGQSC